MKVFKYFIVAFVIAVSGIAYAYANVVRLALIDYSDFRKLDRNVYLSSTLLENSDERVVSLLADARKRIVARYGKPKANPVIVVLGSEEEQKNYGLNDAPGMLLFAPWNNYLLLNYGTASVDVAAHELVHAEVVNRVGYFKRQLYIPTWFDEGVGMQVEYRPKYVSTTTIDQSEFERLISLSTPGKFWSRDKHQNIENYRTAKLAVSEIFKNSDEGLYAILAKIQSGEESVITSAVQKTNKALQRTSR